MRKIVLEKLKTWVVIGFYSLGKIVLFILPSLLRACQKDVLTQKYLSSLKFGGIILKTKWPTTHIHPLHTTNADVALLSPKLPINFFPLHEKFLLKAKSESKVKRTGMIFP